MDTAVHLFTRKQISDLTRIPDDILNYWMREGVLRAREGGEGRGQHRRFDYPEVTLSAILDQLRGFGLNVAALKKLADRFHVARDYMSGLGVDRSNYDPILDLMRIKRSVEADGTALVYVRSPDEVPGLVAEQRGLSTSSLAVEVTLDEALDHPATWIHWGYKGDRDRVATLARNFIHSTDTGEFLGHWQYWSVLTQIVTKEPDVPGDHYTSTPDYFFRDSVGDWHLSPDVSAVARASLAFIGLNIEALSWRLWHGNQALHA